MASADEPSPTRPSNGIKWHPGHYVGVYVNSPAWQVKKFLYASARFRGMHRLYYWRDLEPDEGHYDFSRIRADLDLMRSLHKQLIVQVEVRSFRKGGRQVPNYITGQAYGEGVYTDRYTGGFHPMLWQPAVRERLAKLYQALGAEFDQDPNFEAIATAETAVAFRDAPRAAPYSDERYLQSLTALAETLKQAFPHTTAIFYTNYPSSLLDDITKVLDRSGVALGSPDIFLDDPALLNGIYKYYPRMSGRVPLAISVDTADYRVRRPGAPRTDPPVAELYAFARERLQVNYVLWIVVQDPIDYFTPLLQFLNSDKVPDDASGGLDARCPSNIAGCVSSQ